MTARTIRSAPLLALAAILVFGAGAVHADERAKDKAKPAKAKAPRGIATVDLRLHMLAPRVVKVGEPFDVIVEVENTGVLALSDVTTDTRGMGNAKKVAPKGAKGKPRVDKRIAPGATVKLVHRYVLETAGKHRLTASCREARGWAAAGRLTTVEALDPAAFKADPAHAATLALDTSLSIRVLDAVVPEKDFRVELTLRNTGDLALSGVILGWTAQGGVTQPVKADSKEEIGKLKPGTTHVRTLTFTAPKTITDASRVLASVREARGWSASGAYVLVKDLGDKPPKKD